MQYHSKKNILFDFDLVGKWGALDYLSCVYNDKTNMSVGPGGSTCEADYAPEFVMIPREPGLKERCILNDGSGRYLPLGISSTGGGYCIAEYNFSGTPVPIMYNTDQSNPPTNYDPSKATLNRGALILPSGVSSGGRQFVRFIVLYPEVWYDGNPGLPDKKGKFYDSNFYKGFFLGRLDGFDLVYPENDTPGWNNIPVRIFKISG